MNLRTLIFTENDCFKNGRTITPRGVMVHATGANNPWLKRYVGPDDGALGGNVYGNHWNRPGVGACVHAFIGKLADGSVATYQTLPWSMRGWHCGRSGNDTHVSFELCEDGLEDGAYFAQVLREAVELTAMLCRTYGLDPLSPGVVVDHAEGNALGIASNHGDVGYWFRRHGTSMDQFRARVSGMMKGELDMTQEELERLIDQRIRADREGRTYKTLEDVPAWGKPTVEKLVASGALLGDGTGLNLSYDLLRTLVLLDRQQTAPSL